MNKLNTVILFSALTFGVSHANTVPCNGFKIYFKNNLKQHLVIDRAQINSGSVSSTDPLEMDSKKKTMFTVNESVEGSAMMGEFIFHSVEEPSRHLKINFTLANKNMICELNNHTQEGTLSASKKRVLGGVIFHVRG